MQKKIYIHIYLYILLRNGGKTREGEEEFRPEAEGFRRVTLSGSDISLQEAPPTTMTSEADRYKCDPRAQGERLWQSQCSSPKEGEKAQR